MQKRAKTRKHTYFSLEQSHISLLLADNEKMENSGPGLIFEGAGRDRGHFDLFSLAWVSGLGRVTRERIFAYMAFFLFWEFAYAHRSRSHGKQDVTAFRFTPGMFVSITEVKQFAERMASMVRGEQCLSLLSKVKCCNFSELFLVTQV